MVPRRSDATMTPDKQPPMGPCLTPKSTGTIRKGVGFAEHQPASWGASRIFSETSMANKTENQTTNARRPCEDPGEGIRQTGDKVHADIDEGRDKGESIRPLENVSNGALK